MPQKFNDLSWKPNGVPVSRRFDDPYYSLDNGLDETTHVFLTGNGLPERFYDGFSIGELGFGTGLNFLATLKLWQDSGQKGCLEYISFEAFPLEKDELLRAHAAFPVLVSVSELLVGSWDALKQSGVVQIENIRLTLVRGDARKTLPQWQGLCDCWYLDGFSPAKNPELWEPELMKSVAEKSKQGGTLATYSAASFVRQNLADAGFSVSRVKGFGRKKHMTTAVMDRQNAG